MEIKMVTKKELLIKLMCLIAAFIIVVSLYAEKINMIMQTIRTVSASGILIPMMHIYLIVFGVFGLMVFWIDMVRLVHTIGILQSIRRARRMIRNESR